MNKQPEALRLAEWIEDDMSCQGDAEIAAELRRLCEMNAELLEALRPFAETDLTTELVRDTFGFDVLRARAAIAKATGEQQ